MISAWQKARNQPPHRIPEHRQQETLLKEAATALSKHDEQKKAEDEAKTRLAVAVPATVPGDRSPSPSDGLWRGTFECSGGWAIFLPPFKL